MARSGNFAGSLDTNVILRLMLDDIPTQTAAADLLLKQPGQLVIADIAIVETVFVLERYYELPRMTIAEIIIDFLNRPKLFCNRTLVTRALPIFIEKPKLSFEDCCLAAYTDLNSAAPLWTFDKKLAAQTNATLVPQA